MEELLTRPHVVDHGSGDDNDGRGKEREGERGIGKREDGLQSSSDQQFKFKFTRYLGHSVPVIIRWTRTLAGPGGSGIAAKKITFTHALVSICEDSDSLDQTPSQNITPCTDTYK